LLKHIEKLLLVSELVLGLLFGIFSLKGYLGLQLCSSQLVHLLSKILVEFLVIKELEQIIELLEVVLQWCPRE
jgi:hypothetical protein